MTYLRPIRPSAVGTISAATISDATTLGRQLLQATDAAAVRSLIGAGQVVGIGRASSGRVVIAPTGTPAGLAAGDAVIVVP